MWEMVNKFFDVYTMKYLSYNVCYIYVMMSVKLIMVKSNTKLGMNCVTFFLFFICSVCGDLFSLVLTMEFSYKKVIREKIVIIN